MLWWIIGVAVACLIWLSIWKRSLSLGVGVLVGVLLAWLLSYFLEPYVTDMASIPVWLPPLPLATVAVVLLIYGALVWVRGNEGLPKGSSEDHGDHH